MPSRNRVPSFLFVGTAVHGETSFWAPITRTQNDIIDSSGSENLQVSRIVQAFETYSQKSLDFRA